MELEATIDFSLAMVTEEREIFHGCVFTHMTETGFVEIMNIHTSFSPSPDIYEVVCLYIWVYASMCVCLYMHVYSSLNAEECSKPQRYCNGYSVC